MKLTKTAVLTLTTVGAAAIGAGTRFLTGSKILDPSQRLSKEIAGAAAITSIVQLVSLLVLECHNKPTKEAIAKQLISERKDAQRDNGANTKTTEVPLLSENDTHDLDKKLPGHGNDNTDQEQTTSGKPCTQSNGFFIGMEVAGVVVGVATGYLGVVAMGLATSKLVAGITLGAGVVTMAGAGCLYNGCNNPCKNTSEDRYPATTFSYK